MNDNDQRDSRIKEFSKEEGTARGGEKLRYGVQVHFVLSYSIDVEASMKTLNRITFNPGVMGGKPCIRGLRVTVGTIVGLMASGRTKDEILKLYPYLEPEDIDQALAYAAWRVEEIDVPVITA
jgi:uncharacterized protein (DUF433 family)